MHCWCDSVTLIFRKICCLSAAGVIGTLSTTVHTVVFKVCVLHINCFLLLVVSRVFDLTSIVYYCMQSVCTCMMSSVLVVVCVLYRYA